MTDDTATDALPGDVHAGPAATGYAAMEISQVITRACTRCGGPRDPSDPSRPCDGCGLDAPAVQHDNGIVSAAYRDPERQSLWQTVGKHLAAQRIAAANLYHSMTKE